MMEKASSDMLSATAIYDDAPKAERAIAWLLNVGLRESQISQTAEAAPGQTRPADAPAPRKQRRSFVDSLVDFVLPDDNRSKAIAGGLPSVGPRSVTVTDIQPVMFDTVVRILSDEGTVKPVLRKTDMADAGDIRGLIGACLVDVDSGRMLGSEGRGKLDLDLVATLDTDFMRTWNQTAEQLDMVEPLEEILMTLDTQVHLFRPLEQHPSVLLHVALDKATCNLGMARIQLKNLEANLAI